ncbi:MAG: metallophosphoesterase family protein [Saprospiraceae bacterium]|nr:metallophosphoesterase family protein [Saprospiraceae bacterium]
MSGRLHKNMDKLMGDPTNPKLLRLNIGHDHKFIIFSDIHRGLKDTVDDFSEYNKLSYHTALEEYLKENFTLIHLGDIDELKENWDIKKVLDTQIESLHLESKFHNKNQYLRVFGNHDSPFENQGFVKKYLHPHFPGLVVYEGILLQYGGFPNILMVHGHQSYAPIKTDLFEYIFLPIYRWWINDVRKKNRTVYYDSYCDIEKDENDFYSWVSKQQNTLLIFAHTHRPLWGGKTVVDNYEIKLRASVHDLVDKAAKYNVNIQEVRNNPVKYDASDIVNEINQYVQIIREKMKEHGVCRAPKPLPLIYNTGCCIYKDGDITGIEIDKGMLRLIKWGRDKSTGRIEKTILEENYLGNIITQ